MTDIVDRLRDTPNWQRQDFKTWKDGCSVYDRAPFEAADEIERLRGIIEEQRLTIGALNMKLGGATTLENLRAADQPSALTGVEFLHRWMETPNPMLGYVSPLDMMDIGRGAKLAKFIRQEAADNEATVPTPECICGRGDSHVFNPACPHPMHRKGIPTTAINEEQP